MRLGSVYTPVPLLPQALPRHSGEQEESPAVLGRSVRHVGVHGHHAYVGASDGQLHHYSWEPPTPTESPRPNAPAWECVASVTVSSGKAVEKVLVLPGLSLIAVLCGTFYLLTQTMRSAFSAFLTCHPCRRARGSLRSAELFRWYWTARRLLTMFPCASV